ncbi:gap junction beta-2 protein-like [Enoplosus armatus]|uniref:gap junction beta-2 protein-like n=1 Tax=Enoplosus armatus TaxID=215367 RepID=UPI0039956D77
MSWESPDWYSEPPLRKQQRPLLFIKEKCKRLQHLVFPGGVEPSRSGVFTVSAILPGDDEDGSTCYKHFGGACLLRAKLWHRQPDGAKALRSGSEVKESWCFLSQLLALGHSSAGLLGKTVLPVLQLIRLVVVGAAVQPLWHNHFRDFLCDVEEPGCRQAVFNQLFPFSLHQYWTLQVVLVLAPGLIFFCYLVHLIVSEKKCFSIRTAQELTLRIVYWGHIWATSSAVVLLEPCPHRVQCFVSKAEEKTVFMVIMFSVSGLLTLVEMRQNNTISETSGFQMRSKVEEEVDTTDDNECCTKLDI